jgi:DNA-directed RNA polymerase specialized sigma54-like protein
MFNALIGLRLKQQLALTPRLQQSVKLLQLSALDCVQELNQAMALNPFLEEVSETESADGSSADEPPEESVDRDLDYADVNTSNGADELPDWTEWTARPTSLRDCLKEQLLLLGLSERDYALATLIVEALDEDGFLRQPLDKLLADDVEVAPEELETALRIVQSLEPSGIAARDLSECLSLQLQALEASLPSHALAVDIARDKLNMMVARDHCVRLSDAPRRSCKPHLISSAASIRAPAPRSEASSRAPSSPTSSCARRRSAGSSASTPPSTRASASISSMPTVCGALAMRTAHP